MSVSFTRSFPRIITMMNNRKISTDVRVDVDFNDLSIKTFGTVSKVLRPSTLRREDEK